MLCSLHHTNRLATRLAKRLATRLTALLVTLFAALMTSSAPAALAQTSSPASSTDAYFSKLAPVAPSKQMGCIVGKTSATFRLFAPRATSVTLVRYAKHDDATGRETQMQRGSQAGAQSAQNAAWDGVWEVTESGAPDTFYGTFYGYRVDGARADGAHADAARETFDKNTVVGDPYSRAVASTNTFPQTARTLILRPDFAEKFDWKGDKWVVPANHNSLVIYEAHVRDLTAHSSSGISEELRGTYLGLVEDNKAGGLAHLKRLGVNAVEFLPTHEFNNIELPYKDSSALRGIKQFAGQFNDYNPYERNHWGYMTSYYFAPESYYATEQTLERGKTTGVDGRAAREMKEMIRTLHRENIAVILDVVYNHVSDFDFNPLKFIDKFYYFRTEPDGRYVNTSYCGNDFKTERAMARRLVVESVKFWMTEYHVDGFRFDLAAMLDTETCVEIAREARKINPNVVLIAEPWGGNKYNPAGFSTIGWAAWNDRIRNGVKGQNPNDGLGFIFGKHQGINTQKIEQSFITGTLRDDGGLFLKKEHSVNYLESHDDETMGDFIRVGLRDVTTTQTIANLDAHAKLTPKQLALNKLAALFLCASQGPVMIHEGQEYARSKVAAAGNPNDQNAGKLDRNSYNKDNETNYLNYRHASSNRDLVDYYAGLIALRRAYPAAFGGASKADISFLPTDDDFTIAFRIRNANAGKTLKSAKGAQNQASQPVSQPKSFLVVLNGNPDKDIPFRAPAGSWLVLADGSRVTLEPLGSITSKGSTATVVRRSSGLIWAEK
jgi:pullulanase